MPNATEILRGLSDKDPTEIKASKAIAALLNQFGGYDEWARQVALDMEAAKPGGTVRAALHRLFLNAIMRYDIGESEDDGETEEQLEATIRQQIMELESQG